MSNRTRKRPSGPPDTTGAAAGLFEPEEAPAAEAPAAAGPEPSPDRGRVRFPIMHHLSYEDGCFHVITEPDHPLPRLVLASVIDCLHPDQLPRLAAILKSLLEESRPEIHWHRYQGEDFQPTQGYTFNPNATAEDIPQ